ncbi:MAG: RluA family pseudouridine synthase [Clostridiales bacterium]|nr:RluA family pseudouridine synthase [Clostridiales bacterium]
MKPNILYEDKSVIVCIKAPGMPVQSDLTGDLDLLTILINHYKNNGIEEPYIGLIHRLDRPVGGLIVFGKTPRAVAHLSKQMQKRTIRKTYLAVVEGSPDDQTLIHFLKKKFKGNVSSVVEESVPKAKKAIMHIKRISSKTIEEKKYSLISIKLETGRHHQIRVQLAHIGCPIWGDTKYNKCFNDKQGWFNMALFAHEITFINPENNRHMTFETPVTEYPFDQF